MNDNSVAIDIGAGAQDKEIPYKPFPLDDKHKPHGERIDLLEVSPNGKYLVTYSKQDKVIALWNVGYVEGSEDLSDRLEETNQGEKKKGTIGTIGIRRDKEKKGKEREPVTVTRGDTVELDACMEEEHDD